MGIGYIDTVLEEVVVRELLVAHSLECSECRAWMLTDQDPYLLRCVTGWSLMSDLVKAVTRLDTFIVPKHRA